MKEELETGKGKDMVRLTKKEVHKEKDHQRHVVSIKSAKTITNDCLIKSMKT